VTLDEILSDERSVPFQWVEIEGIRWIPTDRAPMKSDDWTVGAYYFGLDYRTVSGLLSSNQKFRSGKVNHAKGREEFESARIVLQDETDIAYEGDVNGDGPAFTLKPNGFWSWLLSYGDRTNVANTRMTSSTGAGLNSEEGLDPKDWSGTYGRKFTVDSITGFPAASTEDSYLYVGKETMWYGESGASYFGDAADTDDMERGRFGSMNSLHEYNKLTGVYPEVTDKPVCWNGRWVRWWLNAIDPATGYPFPKSIAQARTYLWGTHEQMVGPSSNRWEVMLSSFEEVLQAKIPQTLRARAKGINIRFAKMDIGVVGSVGNTAQETLTWKNEYFDTLDDFLNDTTDGLNAKFNGLFDATSKFTCSAAVSKGTMEITARMLEHNVLFRFDSLIAKILGYKPNETVPAANPSELSTPPGFGEEQQFPGSDTPADVAIDRMALKIYVEDDDTDEWPSIGVITGSTDQVVAVVEAGSDEREFYRFSYTSAAVGSDSDGDFITVIPKPSKWLKSMLGTAYRRQDIAASNGSGEVKVTLALSTDKLRAHEFFLRALMSTGFGINPDSTYDIWPKGFGLGINVNLIGWPSIKSISEQLKMWRVYTLMSPTSLMELLEEELKFPNGIILRQDSEGRIQWQLQAFPLTNETVPSIHDEDWLRRSAAKCSHSSRNIVNRYVFDIDYDPLNDKYQSKVDAREPNSIARYGSKAVTGKHRGIRTDIIGTTISSAGNPFAYFPNLCQIRFQRYGFEMATISGQINMRGLALNPGDSVRVTHGLLQDTYDGTSNDGISNRACEILKVDKDDVRGVVEVEAMYDGLERRFGGYAPAMVISAWVGGAANTASVYPNALRDSDDGYDSALFARFDVVHYYQGGVRDPVSNVNIGISSVASDGLSVSLNGIPHTSVADGDVLVWASYDKQQASQKNSGYVSISQGGYVDSGSSVKGWDYGI
jgi:hypothetical protein